MAKFLTKKSPKRIKKNRKINISLLLNWQIENIERPAVMSVFFYADWAETGKEYGK